jgi:hypothetical protein
MITESLISSIREFAKIDGPLDGHQVVANDAGQLLADKLSANKDIVLLGTLLMDCVIGIAIKEKRLPEHVSMCHQKAKELLDNDPNISHEEKENVLFCVLEHHGVPKFSTLESEIVSNADCYRFASISGLYVVLHQFSEVPGVDFKNFIKAKINEKVTGITLDLVKNELKDQITTINNFVKYL